MKRKKTMLILIISIVATLIIIGVLIFAFRIVKNKNKNISLINLTLQDKVKEKENSTLFAEKISETESLLTSMNSYLVDTNKVDTFVSYLEDIGINLGSEVLVKSVEVPTKAKNTILFSLSITGSFDQVVKTIALLENIPYQINIDKVFLNKEINPQRSEDTKNPVLEIPTWRADVSFNILTSN